MAKIHKKTGSDVICMCIDVEYTRNAYCMCIHIYIHNIT